MGISNDSKQAIKQEIEKLEGKKSILIKQIKEIKERFDRFSARRDEIVTAIQKLKADIN